ncbi:hypothetical protein KPH14_011299 [Odynerus spinipes]|uniref:Fatty acyl-CoA reductase n=2 Tax=Odynerus spinipes TaxID=1348599 RepID=A0AAD9RA11_9HYME|nr:hypothetical protein KPH14_011299 [Odynerus spinipes]
MNGNVQHGRYFVKNKVCDLRPSISRRSSDTRRPSRRLLFHKVSHDRKKGIIRKDGLWKCFVEKILRTCSDIKRLYLLVRVKKDKLIEKRIDDYFDNVLFDVLRKTRPNFRQQISIIEGDLSLPGIGISSEDRRHLIDTVDVIIHNAAMVIFSAKISTLLSTNVLGTKEMLDLAVECRHLKADLQIVRDMIRSDIENEAGLSKEVLSNFLGPFPNPYVFTKAIAESIVQDYAKKVSFPCGVFRMSIVLSTYKEPLTAWCGNMNGPTFSLVGIGLGLIHAICIAKHGAPDLVPADMTANACLAAVWDLVENKKDHKEGCIYNYGSSVVNPLSYYYFQEVVQKYGVTIPSSKNVWKCCLVLCTSYRLFMVYHVLFHYIPAIIADIFCLVQFKKPKFMSMLLRIEKHRSELLYFMVNNWTIKVDEMVKIWERMNTTDHELFFCDLRELDWERYCIIYWRGLRVYLLKDPMDNLEEAKRTNLYELRLLINYVKK